MIILLKQIIKQSTNLQHKKALVIRATQSEASCTLTIYPWPLTSDKVPHEGNMCANFDQPRLGLS